MVAPNPRNCHTCEFGEQHSDLGKAVCTMVLPKWLVSNQLPKTVTNPQDECPAFKANFAQRSNPMTPDRFAIMRQERLKELLHYDPETGEFMHRVSRPYVVAGTKVGTVGANGYVVIRLEDKLYYAHRLAWLYIHGDWPENVIDHINGDRCDNRLVNLRAATQHQNMRNRGCQSNNKSGFKGVSWAKNVNKWVARIKTNDRYLHLGCFEEIEDAADAYAKAAQKLHGEFANSGQASDPDHCRLEEG